ncbi:aspartate/glutamate racemase family protein [Caballeronia sp. SEWSISQ10-4 2]|uniref:aspartate/glutamate racemase family protein n=1 Tax=Caballeronia sp. SEWSISQ10-4 2 TaxID=2937438 RepID=UPI002652B6C6|nr:aspartate/glutamate racemase family protein [Caballeronia sp. SEWSISQ10-4 2]MDN7177356.1 aspartate/glutamate racemase family protein [Caballeronia sp. SEWSISQ10-4 2]
MRICWIHPTTKTPELAPLWTTIEQTVSPDLLPGTEIEYRFSAGSANFTRSSYAEHLNSVLMLDQAIQAEKDGFDGVFIGCWNDALWEAREVLSIPVASVGEQSMLAALAMGQRFAVVTVSQKTAVAIERDLFAYGLHERAISRPVRSIAPESDGDLLLGAVTDPHSGFIPRFEAAARGCIADGADIILVGCAYYGPLLRRVGYTHVADTGIPVIDSTTVAIKYLEAMVGVSRATGITKSMGPMFRTPDPAKIERARAALAVVEAGKLR